MEKLSGVSFEDFLRKYLFEPAGMNDTGIFHTRRDGIPSDRFARNMVWEGDVYVPSDLSKETAGYVVGSDGLNGCDYTYTTLFDMLRWDRALREGKIITPGEQKLMYAPCRLNSGETYVDEDGDMYGFGWGVNHDEKLGLIVSHGGGMPGLNTWFERFIDRDAVLLIFANRDPGDARAFERFWDGMRAVARGEEPEPVISIEDIAEKAPDKSGWGRFCGKYEHKSSGDEDFVIDEIFMKDGELWANAIIDGDETSFRLYPIGENAFGRKRGFLRLTFGNGCLMYDNLTCRKL